MSTVAKRRYTVEEYLAFERESESKHEFFDGELFAMAGATATHNLITGNLVTLLNQSLRDRNCRVFPSDMRVLCPTGLRTYPDVSTLCGPPEYEDERQDTLLNPKVIIEVLSPSTAGYDRGRKFVNYRTIPALEQYVVVEPAEALVDCLTRRPNGGDDEWVLTSATNLEAVLKLSAVDVELPLSEIYFRVEFPAPDAVDAANGPET